MTKRIRIDASDELLEEAREYARYHGLLNSKGYGVLIRKGLESEGWLDNSDADADRVTETADDVGGEDGYHVRLTKDDVMETEDGYRVRLSNNIDEDP